MKTKNSFKQLLLKHKNFIIIIVIAILTLGLIILKNFPIYKQKSKKLELGHNYTIEKLLLIKNKGYSFDFASNDEKYVAKELGIQTIEFRKTKSGKSEIFKLEYEVVDTVAPKIISKEKIVTSIGSSKGTIRKKIKIKDCSRSISCVLNGNVNFDEPGYYGLLVSAKDEANNTSYKKIKVKVEEDDEGNIVDWSNAYYHSGEYCTVKGVVADKSYKPYVNGSPTFINIGNSYPNNDRFQAIVWGSDLSSSIQKKLDSFYSGNIVKISGYIEIYRGVPQITIRDASQIIVSTNKYAEKDIDLWMESEDNSTFDEWWENEAS